MKQHIISALAVMLLASAGLSAQSFHQGFFLDGYRLNYRYNPAVSNDGNFLSVGQWSDQSINNVGAANFLYPREVGLVTAFHSSVSAKDFLGSLPDKLALGGNINFNLVSYGFALNAAVARFRITAGFSNGFGGTIPYTSTPRKPITKYLLLVLPTTSKSIYV